MKHQEEEKLRPQRVDTTPPAACAAENSTSTPSSARNCFGQKSRRFTSSLPIMADISRLTLPPCAGAMSSIICSIPHYHESHD